jgi:hypothetical protein
MFGVSGVDGAGPIWHDFMEEVLKGRPVRNFQRPDGVVEVEVCESSGLLATPYCPRRKRELFIAGTEPMEYDNTYIPFQIDAATGLLWAPGCQGPMVERVYRILPPEAREWGRRNGIPEPPTETCRPIGDAGQVAIRNSQLAIRNSQFALAITKPHPNSTFALTSELPLVFQKIEVAAQVGDALAEVGRARQVLVITHLPQIAARASHHVTVAKRAKGGIATADVAALGGRERVDELARMLGDAGDPMAMRHAKEMLKKGRASVGA